MGAIYSTRKIIASCLRLEGKTLKIFVPSSTLVVNWNINHQSHSSPSSFCYNLMAAKPLTTAAIAMTEKKMDMSLDDIIKMSKNGTGLNKARKQRIPNKNQKFSNNVVQDKSMKLRRFMDTRSTLRQGVLGQRRTNFQGNRFSFAAEAARKAAVAPFRNSNFNRSQAVTSYRPRAVGRPVQNRAVNGGGFVIMKQQGKVVPKQKGQTLDSLFANMKEQRMKVLSHQQQQQNNNVGRRNGAGQQRPRWSRTRYNN
ncbi:hypothetical protein L1987_56187 [Smallanthus sonchifolius]|uniref:Uncharacterized protein n=1 Tax=Smallanthus sonchifolius TaxID=185202 RepID=A0ACB9EC39_9ASTR|nr:hypothetical protein L1987_56187 [Smallanthus sonchifolius]